MEEFQKLITKDNTKKAHDNLLDELKLAIKEASSNSHQWDNKAKAAEKAAYKEWQENCRKDTQQREDEARWREEERREKEARRRHQQSWYQQPRSQERHDQERQRQQEHPRQYVPMSIREKLNNAYTILGLSGSENFTTVKTAYRKLSLIHHPDKGGDEERFKEINNAYHLILDSL